MKNFLAIVLNRFKTVGIDYLMEVIIGSVTEYRRARREGHFDKFRKQENVSDHDSDDKYTPFENR